MDACFILDYPRARGPFLRIVLLCLSILPFSYAKANEEIRVGMSGALSGLNAGTLTQNPYCLKLKISGY